MSFYKKLFGQKEDIPVADYSSFWTWFAQNQHRFYTTIRNHDNVEEEFLDKVMPRLEQLNSQFYCFAGMLDDHTAEMVITPEGDIKTVVFAEELVAAAPELPGWKFTALKPAIGFGQVGIEMKGYEFNTDTMSFFCEQRPDYPDEIEISLIHKDLTEENKSDIFHGSILYIDNAMGELNALTLIDRLTVTGVAPPGQDLIPLEKLPEYLQWREKEFIEKYKGMRRDIANDGYANMEAEDEEGRHMLATLNTDLLNWNSKASHPWMMTIEISYQPENESGMPGEKDFNLMNEFEEQLDAGLVAHEGYLNIGHELYNGKRTIYFACKEFRLCSKVTQQLIDQYLDKIEISYDIYKDKYWMTMNKFSG